MSYDNTRTVKQKQVGDIEISIEGGVYYPDGDGCSSWDYWVEVVRWNSQGEGTTIEKGKVGGESDMNELEEDFERLCKKHLKKQEAKK